MCGCLMPKQHLVALCDFKLYTMLLWHVISVKLNIKKKEENNRVRNNELNHTNI